MTATNDPERVPVYDARDRDSFIAALFAFMRRTGASYYDERVTQLEHALQTAAIVAEAGAAPSLIAAALLHDIGHLLAHEHADNSDFLQVDHQHEEVGGDWLSRAFPDSVVAPVRLHVPAKRYLCAVDPTYWAGLSPASQRSLLVQGGPMTAETAARFAVLPGCNDAVQLRRADDEGKVPRRVTPPLETYSDTLRALLR